MHALIGYLEFPAGQREATLAALHDVSTHSRQDPGCVDYWLAEDVEQPNRSRFFECWENVEAFEATRPSPTKWPSWRTMSPGSPERTPTSTSSTSRGAARGMNG